MAYGCLANPAFWNVPQEAKSWLYRVGNEPRTTAELLMDLLEAIAEKPGIQPKATITAANSLHCETA